jgi:plastocyanin
MTKRLVVFLCLMALVPFALAACGDDDDGGDETAATTTEETDAGGDSGGDTGGGGGTVAISADPSGNLAYEQDSVSAPAGTVTIEFTNDSSVPHDVKIEGPEGDLGGTDTVTGGTAEADVELEAGEYTFYCSVDGHRDLGMEGTLTVE